MLLAEKGNKLSVMPSHLMRYVTSPFLEKPIRLRYNARTQTLEDESGLEININFSFTPIAFLID